MQTILGASGAVGIELAKELPRYTTHIRLVSRHPQKVNEGDELLAADLTKAADADKAVAGSEIVYLVVGLPYKTKVWQQQWPLIMRNVIDACIKYKSKLVFFDNIYMYDAGYLKHLTEETPVAPCSKKGEVRAQIAQTLLDAAKAGMPEAMIVRAADFIASKNSVLVEMVAKNYRKGKKASWMIDADKIHSFTYVPDAAKATALLGNTPDAYGQIWHLPTSTEKLTGRQWMELFAKQTGSASRFSVLSKSMMGLLGFFVPVLREFKEMSYQYDRDYFFDSSKFTTRFGIAATAPQNAVSEVLKSLKDVNV